MLGLGYFNCALCYNIKSNVTNNAMVVIASAMELSTGMTKLSGSNPLLKVNMEIIYEATMIATKAIMLETKSIGNRLKIPCRVNVPFNAKDKKPRTAKSMRVAVQALKMFLA